jgi:hypothetical protein
MIDPVSSHNQATLVPLAAALVLVTSLVTHAAIPGSERAGTPVGQTNSLNLDASLRSAYLMREVDRYADDTAHPRQQLQRHFQAVLSKLVEDHEISLSVALDRLETHQEAKWQPAERRIWRARLARNRAANMVTLKQYQLNGRFPLNNRFAAPTPIFLDQGDTACAVGYLMRTTGWSEAVESVAQASNFVFINDVVDGPVLEWILQSGLTREEAALIQPAYRCNDPPTISTVPFTSGSLTLTYAPMDGHLSMNIGDGSMGELEIRSAQGSLIPEGANPNTFVGTLDAIDVDRLFVQRADGLATAVSFGTVLPPQLAADDIIADLSIGGSINVSGCDRLFLFPESGIVRWDNGQRIVGTEAFNPKPGLQLGFRDLRYAWLGGMDLAESNFESSDLSHARLSGATLSDASLEEANLSEAFLDTATLAGARLSGANLTKAVMFFAVLEGADLSGSALVEARLYGATLNGADLSDANLTAAAFFQADLTSANLSGSGLKNADFSFTPSLDGAVFSAETTYNQWTMFPDGFDAAARGLTQVLSQPGDLDDAAGLAAADVDLLGHRLRNQLFMSWQFEMFDLNGDSMINTGDLDTWVQDFKGTWYGDANLDGQFDSSDLIDVLAAGQYEDGIAENSGWATGDWDADRDFTSSDLLRAFQNGGYEQGPRAAVKIVPEPASVRWLLVSLLATTGFAARLRHRAF